MADDLTIIQAEIDIDITPPPVQGNSPDEDNAVRTCYEWFVKDREAKQDYVAEMEEMWKLYKGDHWSLIGPGGVPLRTDEQKKARPNSVENITFALIEGLVAEFAQDVDIVDFPVEQGDEEAANIMTDLKRFIAYKNRISQERLKWLRWFFLYGTGIWHVYWDPNWKGGRGPNRWVGDIRWQAMHPQTIFPDARCRESIHDGTRIHKAYYKSLEYIREHYPERGHLVDPDALRSDMLIGEDDTDVTGWSGEEQALLVETWYKGEPLILGEGEENLGPGLHVIWWAGDGQCVYLRHANYVYFEPGEDVLFPFDFSVCYHRENSVWGFGEAYFLKNPQIIYNKTSELILEGHLHHALGQTWYNENAVTPAQKKIIERFGTLPGMWFAVRDVNGIKREYGSGVPASLQNEMQRLQRAMETIIGRFDISQGRTPGSVTAFRALDLLAARAQVRLRSKEMAMTSSYENVGNYINKLITQFYTERRAYRILGQQDTDQPRYGMFKLEDIQKVYIYNTNEVVPLKQFQPGGLVEGEDYEVYAPEFDVVCKVSTTLPTDRLFYMEMAKELFAAQMIDAETFWYVMHNGKFPPFEELLQKEAEKRQQAEMQAMMQGLPGGMPGGGGQANLPMSMPAGLPQGFPPGAEPALPGAMPSQPPTIEDLQQVLAQRPDLEEKLAALTPEQQQIVIAELQKAMGGGGNIAS